MKKDWKIAEKRYFTKSADVGAKCDHFQFGVRATCEVRACDPKKGRKSHLVNLSSNGITLWQFDLWNHQGRIYEESKNIDCVCKLYPIDLDIV